MNLQASLWSENKIIWKQIMNMNIRYIKLESNKSNGWCFFWKSSAKPVRLSNITIITIALDFARVI